MNSIAVVGIGNSLLKDDGVGVHVLEHFAGDNPFMDVICLDAGTVGLALMDHLSNLDGLIAVDAMRLKKKPGTITVLQGAAMDSQRFPIPMTRIPERRSTVRKTPNGVSACRRLSIRPCVAPC